jgi:hypothetical protein
MPRTSCYSGYSTVSLVISYQIATLNGYWMSILKLVDSIFTSWQNTGIVFFKESNPLSLLSQQNHICSASTTENYLFNLNCRHMYNTCFGPYLGHLQGNMYCTFEGNFNWLNNLLLCRTEQMWFVYWGIMFKVANKDFLVKHPNPYRNHPIDYFKEDL